MENGSANDSRLTLDYVPLDYEKQNMEEHVLFMMACA